MTDASVLARALAWSRHETETLCESAVPVAHGIVYRSDEFPDFAAVNLVRVTGDPGWSAPQAAAFADDALRGLRNRLIIFEDVAVGERLRPGLGALGYRTTRIVWMRHDGRRPAPSTAVEGITLREVPDPEVRGLRAAWLHEDFPGRDVTEHLEQMTRARSRMASRTIAAFAGADPVGFAALDLGGTAAEVGAVYVRAEARGQGIGTLLTAAAIEAAGPVPDLWISADDEDRPQALYARLGFEPVLRVMDCIRLG